jgi:folate-dependent phosphoribosylglycinamide formyltransferase PurN
MSIVFITIPGDSKREFANMLHKATDGGVSLVIIQKKQKVRLLDTLSKLRKTVGAFGILKESFCAVLLRLDKNVHKYLDYFRLRTSKENTPNFIPKTVEVESVNSDKVFELIKEIKPRLLVVWGTGVIKPHIFNLADTAINLHMGLAPYYRGAVANHFAILHNDIDKIGATIHYLHEKVDAGDILETVTIEGKLPPKQLFKMLNDEAEARFLDIATRLYKGETVPAREQKTSLGKNILLREWVPSVRYLVGQKIKNWEEKSWEK